MKEAYKTYFIYVEQQYVGAMYARSPDEARSRFYHKHLQHLESDYKAYTKKLK